MNWKTIKVIRTRDGKHPSILFVGSVYYTGKERKNSSMENRIIYHRYIIRAKEKIILVGIIYGKLEDL